MIKNSACIKNASHHAQTYASALTLKNKSNTRGKPRRALEVLNFRVKWCLGPESNRHDPVKESQDFKSYYFSSQAIESIYLLIFGGFKMLSKMLHSICTNAQLCAFLIFLNFGFIHQLLPLGGGKNEAKIFKKNNRHRR